MTKKVAVVEKVAVAEVGNKVEKKEKKVAEKKARYGKFVKVVFDTVKKAVETQKTLVTKGTNRVTGEYGVRYEFEYIPTSNGDTYLVMNHYNTRVLVYNLTKKKIQYYQNDSNSGRDAMNNFLDAVEHPKKDYFKLDTKAELVYLVDHEQAELEEQLLKKRNRVKKKESKKAVEQQLKEVGADEKKIAPTPIASVIGTSSNGLVH